VFVVYPDDNVDPETDDQQTSTSNYEPPEVDDEREMTREATAILDMESDEDAARDVATTPGGDTSVVGDNEIPDEFTNDVDFDEPSDDMFGDSPSPGNAGDTAVASPDETGDGLRGGRPDAESTSEIMQDEDGGVAGEGPETSEILQDDDDYAKQVLDKDEETTESGNPALEDGKTQTYDREQLEAGQGSIDEITDDAPVDESKSPDRTDTGSNGTGSRGVDPDHEGPWQLQTDFGLTYEFPDTQSLNEWLENRDSLAGYELAMKGEEFHELESWPQVALDESDSAEDIAEQIDASDEDSVVDIGEMEDDNTSGGGPEDIFAKSTFGQASGEDKAETAEPDAENNEATVAATPTVESDSDSAFSSEVEDMTYSPPSREDRWDKVLNFIYPLVPVLFILMLLLLVEATGMYDIRGAVLGTSGDKNASVTDNAKGVQPGNNDVGEEESKNELQLHVDKLIEDARRARDENRLQTALETLKKAEQIDSSRPIIFKMMSNIYEKFGQDKQAEKAEEKYQALSNKN
jgi:hypothetical protein